ncbi:MAG TPA: HEPN domain-containing protein [Spirochaetales bacterium]|nr:HEPN domain-containing protein [Spirochaetales bacterium]
MNNRQQLRDQLQLMIGKAFRSIAAAHRNVEEGDYDFASSRAYYAAFYAMEAVLLTKELSYSKHTGVISAFNQHFVKTDIFPKEFSKSISRLFRERQTGDYDFDLSIDEKDAKEDARIAEKIVNTIIQYLEQNGYR